MGSSLEQLEELKRAAAFHQARVDTYKKATDALYQERGGRLEELEMYEAHMQHLREVPVCSLSVYRDLRDLAATAQEALAALEPKRRAADEVLQTEREVLAAIKGAMDTLNTASARIYKFPQP